MKAEASMSVVALLLLILAGAAAGEVRVVALPGVPACEEGAAYSAPQAALDDAGPGDRVVLCGGTYTGTLRVEQPLTLEARNATHDAVIEAPPGGSGVGVLAEGAVVRGLRVRNATSEETGAVRVTAGGALLESIVAEDSWAGVSGSGAPNTTILSGRFQRNEFGVHLAASPGSRVSGNFFTANRLNGVRVEQGSDSTTVAGNRFEQEGDSAVFVTGANRTRILDNRANGTTCYGFGIMNANFNRVENNTFGYSLLFGGYITGSSRNNEVVGNEFHNSPLGQGLYVAAPENTIRGNHIHNNSGYGVWIAWFQGHYGDRPAEVRSPEDVLEFFSRDIFSPEHVPASTRVEENTIEDNGRDGIRAESAYDASISGNTVLRNGGYGVNVTNTTSLRVEGNTLGGDPGRSIRLERVKGAVLRNNRLPGPPESEITLLRSEAEIDGRRHPLPAPRTSGFGLPASVLSLLAAALLVQARLNGRGIFPDNGARNIYRPASTRAHGMRRGPRAPPARGKR